MEIVLATFGGVFLLISLGLGALTQTRFVQPDQNPPAGDRIAAAVIGIGLIGIAVVLRIDAPAESLVGTFAVTVGLTLLFSLYLFLTRPR
jgi:hypothetical protein